MNNIFKCLYILIILLSSISLGAQSFGVRAGLNYSSFLGPQENAGESFGLSGGFHFGVNYSYHVTDIFSVVFELGYTQNGTRYEYDGDSYFIIRNNENTYWEFGRREDMVLDISNGYIMLPVLANYKISRKLEIFGGAYFNLLVSPTARGSVKFTADNQVELEHDVTFIQSLDYSYGSDDAVGRSALSRARDIGVYIDGGEVYFPKVVGAYYQYAENDANFINAFDAGLIGGVNYFINKGFYAGLRLEYGLTDITDMRADASISELDADNQLIFRDDTDTHLGVNLSIGFRF